MNVLTPTLFNSSATEIWHLKFFFHWPNRCILPDPENYFQFQFCFSLKTKDRNCSQVEPYSMKHLRKLLIHQLKSPWPMILPMKEAQNRNSAKAHFPSVCCCCLCCCCCRHCFGLKLWLVLVLMIWMSEAVLDSIRKLDFLTKKVLNLIRYINYKWSIK